MCRQRAAEATRVQVLGLSPRRGLKQLQLLLSLAVSSQLLAVRTQHQHQDDMVGHV